MAEESKELDRQRLLDLFDMAGPEQAEELAFRLQDDLEAVAKALAQALGSADRQVLRVQSHVLLGISGSVGADGLRALAAQLNSLAHGSGAMDPGALIEDIQRRLARLIAEVRETRALWIARP